MYPELFRIGNFPVNTYGLLLAIGMLLALFAASRLAGRDGLPRERIYDLGLWTLIGGLVGSKILMFSPKTTCRFFRLIFCVRAAFITADFLADFSRSSFWFAGINCLSGKSPTHLRPALLWDRHFGRQGCFAAGCCWGKPTDSAVGVHFTEAGARIYGRSDLRTGRQRFVSASDAALRIDCDARRFRHFSFNSPQKAFRRAGFNRLRHYLFDCPFHHRIFPRRPARRSFRLDHLTGLSTSQIISLIVAAGAVIFMIVRLQNAGKKEVIEQTS
jgi:hypothetical protein